jgi:hypothetical protein
VRCERRGKLIPLTERKNGNMGDWFSTTLGSDCFFTKPVQEVLFA